MKFKPILDMKPLPNPSLAKIRLITFLRKLSIKSAQQNNSDWINEVIRQIYVMDCKQLIYRNNLLRLVTKDDI